MTILEPLLLIYLDMEKCNHTFWSFENTFSCFDYF